MRVDVIGALVVRSLIVSAIVTGIGFYITTFFDLTKITMLSITFVSVLMVSFCFMMSGHYDYLRYKERSSFHFARYKQIEAHAETHILFWDYVSPDIRDAFLESVSDRAPSSDLKVNYALAKKNAALWELEMNDLEARYRNFFK